MKNWLTKQLGKKAQKFLAEHKPIIVGVTGSVGKTSTREAIAAVLRQKYSVVTPKENYNNALGLPLAILQAQAPGRSLVAWMKLLYGAPKRPAQVYVLEYGVDHPGDMDELLAIARPSVAVLTAISPVHVEFFKDVEQLFKEKAKLADAITSEGMVVLNEDDPYMSSLAHTLTVPVMSYGFKEGSDVHAESYEIKTRTDFSFEPGELFSQIESQVRARGAAFLMRLQNQLGRNAVSSALAAVAVGMHLGLSNEEIEKGLGDIMTEPGRMNPIPGIKGSLIIDSTYNAAPASMMAGLRILSEFQPQANAKRIAVLGHMAELGAQTEQEHRLVGMRAAEVCDTLVTVGATAHLMRRAALEAGMPEEDTMEFDDPVSAGRWLDREVKKGDIVLVKGSQSARMEKVVKDVMAEPARAKELLVRQYGKWVEEE